MKKLRAGVMGCGGRMGEEICRIILETEGMELSGGTEVPDSPLIGMHLHTYILGKTGGPDIKDDINKIIEDIDVVIDFTRPEATIKNFDAIADSGKAIIIGTTGFSEEQLEHINSKKDKVRCVMAPNMSVGVNLMFKLVSEAAKVIGSTYDMEIIDIHHNKKVDSPSGTAARLAEICAKETGRDIGKVGNYGRHGIVGERTKDEIGIMSFRAGDVVGEHTVMFAGPGERVEITHKAGSRSNFARGAVRAAQWIEEQKPGIYDMQDVLGLR